MLMPSTNALRLIAIGAASLLSGCMETMPRPDHAGRPQACTMEYAPVCAVKHKRRETFSNSCMARAKGFAVVKQGDCRSHH